MQTAAPELDERLAGVMVLESSLRETRDLESNNEKENVVYRLDGSRESRQVIEVIED